MISIVDDDALLREATANLVRSLGFAAAKFASAEEFLAWGGIGHTRCLIADVQLPGLRGLCGTTETVASATFSEKPRKFSELISAGQGTVMTAAAERIARRIPIRRPIGSEPRFGGSRNPSAWHQSFGG